MNLYATEKEIQAAILDYLETIGAVAIRVNSGMQFIQDSNGSTRVFRGAKRGTADIIALYRGTYYAIECKTRKGRVSPEQFEFLDRVRRAGGSAFVARSVEDVENVLLHKGG